MTKRFGLFGACLVTSLCVLLLLASHQLSNSNHRQVPDFRRNIQAYSDVVPELIPVSSVNVSTTLPTVKEIISQQKAILEQELANYKFPQGYRLQNYTLATNGRPLRNIIVTTWRSGSTFLGDVINAVPGNYYHYEPLLDYEIIQIRGPPYASEALTNLKKLLMCDYSNMEHYLEYGKSHIYLFTHNNRLWDQCQLYQQYCWNETFLNEYCKLFPFQSMKLVRLRLRLAEELLKDDSLGVRVLLLVRDPRGTLQSRKHRDWCPGQADCDQPNLLCADMVSDYSAAIRLQNSYPDRFRAIRYEDFSLDPYKGVEELFSFFNLNIHPNVMEFLDSHTKLNVGGVSSTFRNSKSAPFHWRADLNFSEVQYIEEQCQSAMKYWGYVRAKNETHLREFNPLTDYALKSNIVS
ncbi:uncharacterized protein CBL_04800 [Carabus blaptoides fortunei]